MLCVSQKPVDFLYFAMSKAHTFLFVRVCVAFERIEATIPGSDSQLLIYCELCELLQMASSGWLHFLIWKNEDNIITCLNGVRQDQNEATDMKCWELCLAYHNTPKERLPTANVVRQGNFIKDCTVPEK